MAQARETTLAKMMALARETTLAGGPLDDPLVLDRIVAAHFPDAGSRDASALRCVSAGWRAGLDWRRRRWARAQAAAAAAALPPPPLPLPACWTVGSSAARQQTTALSRAYSIFYALQRLGLVAVAAAEGRQEDATEAAAVAAAAADQDVHVCVHSVGTDAVEGQTVDETVAVFAPLCTLLRAACPRCQRVTVVLNGMDLIVPKGVTVSSPSSSCVETVVDGVTLSLCWRPGVYSSELYDALAAERRTPHAVFCFNAGLWGYDTWTETLEMVLRKGCLGLVVTSYTWQEADDDSDVLQRALDAVASSSSGGGAAARWIWDAERNPYGSTLPRPSYHPGEFLRDNSWWMCAASGR